MYCSSMTPSVGEEDEKEDDEEDEEEEVEVEVEVDGVVIVSSVVGVVVVRSTMGSSQGMINRVMRGFCAKTSRCRFVESTYSEI